MGISLHYHQLLLFLGCIHPSLSEVVSLIVVLNCISQMIYAEHVFMKHIDFTLISFSLEFFLVMQCPCISTESAFFPVTREFHIAKFGGQFSILNSHSSASVDIYFWKYCFHLLFSTYWVVAPVIFFISIFPTSKLWNSKVHTRTHLT